MSSSSLVSNIIVKRTVLYFNETFKFHNDRIKNERVIKQGK